MASGPVSTVTLKRLPRPNSLVTVTSLDGKPVRGTYQVLNTTSHGGFFETFMGDEGSLVVSEALGPAAGRLPVIAGILVATLANHALAGAQAGMLGETVANAASERGTETWSSMSSARQPAPLMSAKLIWL